MRTLVFPLALLTFLTSGFAALVYQVIWQRMLAIFSGVDIYAATVIVAAFMGGLGVGHLGGGHVADRVSRRASLGLFAVAELAIAAFGLFSTTLYYGVLYQRLGQLALGQHAMAVLLFVGLLWPTFFMGASLPLLVRAVTPRIERAARTTGALYGFNTLGAACGAMVATWVLLPRLGLEGSLQVAATLNALCAAVMLPLAALRDVSEAPPTEGETRATVVQGSAGHPRYPFWSWALIYGFSGFVALSYEIVWFRLLGVIVKSTAFTFGTLLALYLGGIGLGAVVGSVLAPRVRRPAAVFFAVQAAIGVTAGTLLVAFLEVADSARALRGYFGGYEPLSVRDAVHAIRTLALNLTGDTQTPVVVPANFLRLYGVVPFALVVPPTFLMGCAFPFLQRVVQTDAQWLGRRVGALLVANIVGSLVGTLITGWLALTVLGTAATFKVLTCTSLVFSLYAVREARRACHHDHVPARGRWHAPVLGTVLTVVVMTLVTGMPDAATLWARLHGTTADRIIFEEDNSGLSLIKAEQPDLAGLKVVFVNGVGQSVIPYGDIHTALGALPALVHENPVDVAILGLGSGDTLYAAAGRKSIERITCIEIVRPQLATLQALAVRDSYGGLRALLRDPRIEHVFGDGRTYLSRTTRRFDIIEADALRPTSAYSGTLYSDAYFTLLKQRLKTNGLAATWAPTARVHDTFVRVFPHVVSVPGILLGSNEPITFELTAIRERLRAPEVRSHYARAAIDIEALMATYLPAEPARFGPDVDRASLVDVNTDLFPKDEFDLSAPK